MNKLQNVPEKISDVTKAWGDSKAECSLCPKWPSHRQENNQRNDIQGALKAQEEEEKQMSQFQTW
jgi:hypothetical protein